MVILDVTAVPSTLELAFTSNDVSVASVSALGKVTAHGEGTAVITVKVGGDGVYALNTTEVTVTVSKVPVEIVVENSTVDLEVNDQIDAGASLTPEEAGNLTFSSSDDSVAKVEDNQIIALSNGTAVITVSFAGDRRYAAAENKTITVNVSLKDAAVSVENDTLNLYIDDVAALVVSTVPSTLEPTFTSSDGSVASVSVLGKVTAHGEGTAVITVKVGGDGVYALNTTEVTVTVSKVPAEIFVEKSNIAMDIGDEVDVGASLTPEEAGNLTFTSSDDSIAKVENGKIIALDKGTATITVSFAGDEKYAAADNKTITVNVGLEDASVSVENDTLDLFVDDMDVLVVNTLPSGLPVTFTSSDGSVASVSVLGEVTAHGEGTAVITVKVGGDGVYALNTTEVTVTVSKVSTEISLVNESADLTVLDEIATGATLTPADAGNLSYA